MICVVIPHYIITEELEKLALRTIESIRNTAEVFILSVNDGSPMDFGKIEEKSNHTIHLKKNSGFAKACNAGFKWTLPQPWVKYIVCANNDIEVYPGWLEALIEPWEKWDEVGITGLVSYRELSYEGVPLKEYSRNKITEGGLLDHWMQSGGLWMSTPEVLRKVGLFDEQFKVGGEEDVDLFLRMRDQHHLRIIMSAKSMFWHKEGATRWNTEIPGYKQKNKEIEQRNYDLFADKWDFDIRKEGLRFYEEILEPREDVDLEALP